MIEPVGKAHRTFLVRALKSARLDQTSALEWPPGRAGSNEAAASFAPWATRRHFSAEVKIRFVLDCLRGEDSIAEQCRKEGIAHSLYYVGPKEFMEAGKHRLSKPSGLLVAWRSPSMRVTRKHSRANTFTR